MAINTIDILMISKFLSKSQTFILCPYLYIIGFDIDTQIFNRHPQLICQKYLSVFIQNNKNSLLIQLPSVSEIYHSKLQLFKLKT